MCRYVRQATPPASTPACISTVVVGRQRRRRIVGQRDGAAGPMVRVEQRERLGAATRRGDADHREIRRTAETSPRPRRARRRRRSRGGAGGGRPCRRRTTTSPSRSSTIGPLPSSGHAGRWSSSASSVAGLASRSARKAAGSTTPKPTSATPEQRAAGRIGDVAPVRQVVDRVGVLVQLLGDAKAHAAGLRRCVCTAV